MTNSYETPVKYKPVWRTTRMICASLAALFAIAILMHAQDAFAKTVKVTMTDTPAKFLPEKLALKAGDTVEWTNNAQTLHTVTADPAKAVNKGDVVLPKGAKPFDSGFMMPGKSY
ncbi:MAG: cupredoxin domain-containing protein, partial [Candidatus Binataceae bacterium]